MTNLKGNYNFVYDNNSQLINATNPEDLASVFSYDSLGNRITDRDGNYVYDSKKQKLQEDWKFTYVYDNSGNLISKVLKSDPTKIVNYNYNSQNQLIALKEFDGVTLQKDSRYYYDAIGRRVAKYHADNADSAKSFVRKYIYDGQEILFEVDGDNDLLTTFTHSMLRTDDVLAMDKGNASYFYLKDHLGSINEIIDSSGNVIQSYSYSAFGKILSIKDGAGQNLSIPVVENFYTFTGRESDFESGLNYYRARYYDPALGRFLAVDPHPGLIDNPITFNSKYIYGNNNPTSMIDPSGRASIFGWALAFAMPGLSFFTMNATDIFENNFSFTDKDTAKFNTTVIVAAAIAVGVVTGGAAAPAASAAATGALGLTAGTVSAAIVGTTAGGLAGTAVGATFGAIAGAALGGTASVLQGGSFESGMLRGGKLGLYGGAAGGMFGANLGAGLSETPGGFGAFIQSNYLGIAGASVLLPFTGEFKIRL